MRLGMNHTLPHASPEEWAKTLRELHCGAAIFPVAGDAPEELIAAYCAAAEKYDIVIAEVGIWANPISPIASVREQAVARSLSQLRLAQRVHARCCVNYAGAKGPTNHDPYPENYLPETRREIVEHIQFLLDTVKPEDTCFTLEPMGWIAPDSPEDYLLLMQQVERPAFQVHMDPINWITDPHKYFNAESFLEHCFSLLGNKIQSCHIKDILLTPQLTLHLQEMPCGKGCFPLLRYAQLIEATDPEMPVLVEHLPSHQDYIDSVKYLYETFQQNKISLR